jgi:PDZ domain-containing secreted protein
LAPIDNCDELSSDNYKSMPVVAVSTVTDAIKAIETYTKTGSIKGLKTCS